MLEDMGKTSFIKEVIDQARSVPKFIYNHIWVLSLMRRHTKNRELRRLAITRFATNFITLQSLLQCLFVMSGGILHIAGKRMGKPLLDWCTVTPSEKEWQRCAQ
jgi:hypothetical protein